MIFPVFSPEITVKTQIYAKMSSDTIIVIAVTSQATSRHTGYPNAEMNTVGFWLWQQYRNSTRALNSTFTSLPTPCGASNKSRSTLSFQYTKTTQIVSNADEASWIKCACGLTDHNNHLITGKDRTVARREGWHQSIETFQFFWNTLHHYSPC